MRPCLGVVILVGAVEVPGTADLLVCGRAEWSGGVDRVTGGQVARGEIGDGRHRVRGGAACGVVYGEFGAQVGIGVVGAVEGDIVIVFVPCLEEEACVVVCAADIVLDKFCDVEVVIPVIRQSDGAECQGSEWDAAVRGTIPVVPVASRVGPGCTICYSSSQCLDPRRGGGRVPLLWDSSVHFLPGSTRIMRDWRW